MFDSLKIGSKGTRSIHSIVKPFSGESEINPFNKDRYPKHLWDILKSLIHKNRLSKCIYYSIHFVYLICE